MEWLLWLVRWLVRRLVRGLMNRGECVRFWSGLETWVWLDTSRI